MVSWRADGFIGGAPFDLRDRTLLGLLRQLEQLFPSVSFFSDSRDVCVDVLRLCADGWCHWASAEREMGPRAEPWGPLRWYARKGERFFEACEYARAVAA